MLGQKTNGRSQIIFNGLKMLQKNIQLLKEVYNSTHTERMHGLRMNGKNQIIFNGLKIHLKNILLLKK